VATNDDLDWNPAFARAFEAVIDQVANADADGALDGTVSQSGKRDGMTD
jgi:hypothetical protein